MSDHETTSLRERLGRALEPVYTRPSFEAPVLVVALLGIVVLLVDSFSYSEDTSLVPRVIGVPTALLVAYLLVRVARSKNGGVRTRNIFDDLTEVEEIIDGDREPVAADATERDRESESESETSPVTLRKRLAVVFIWMIFLVLVVAVVGFIPGVLVFLLGFNHRYFGYRPWVNAVYSGSLTLFIYVVFVILLGVRFPEPFLLA